MYLFPDTTKCLGKGSYGQVYESNNNKYVSKVFDNLRDGLHEYTYLKQINKQPSNKSYLEYHSICYQDTEKIYYQNNNQSVENIENHNLIKNDYVRIFIEKYNYNLNLFKKYLKIGETRCSIRAMLFEIFKSYDTFYQNFIIHADIKMDNILIKSSPSKIIGINGYKLVICDFSLSFFQYSNNLSGELISSDMSLIQTINYRAPEIIFGKTTIDYKIDIWSLGIIILRLFDINLFGINNVRNNSSHQINQQLKNYCKFFGLNNVKNFCQKNNLNCQLPIKNYRNTNISTNHIFESIKDELLKDLLSKMLQLEPDDRISLDNIFQHPYFVNYGFCYHFKNRDLVKTLDNYFNLNQINNIPNIIFNRLDIYIKVYKFLININRSVRMLFQAIRLFEIAIDKYKISGNLINFIIILKIVGCYHLTEYNEDLLKIINTFETITLDDFISQYYNIFGLLKDELNVCCYIDYMETITSDTIITNKPSNLWILMILFLSGNFHYSHDNPQYIMKTLYQIANNQLINLIDNDIFKICYQLYNSTKHPEVMSSLCSLTNLFQIIEDV